MCTYRQRMLGRYLLHFIFCPKKTAVRRGLCVQPEYSWKKTRLSDGQSGLFAEDTWKGWQSESTRGPSLTCCPESPQAVCKGLLKRLSVRKNELSTASCSVSVSHWRPLTLAHSLPLLSVPSWRLTFLDRPAPKSSIFLGFSVTSLPIESWVGSIQTQTTVHETDSLWRTVSHSAPKWKRLIWWNKIT